MTSRSRLPVGLLTLLAALAAPVARADEPTDSPLQFGPWVYPEPDGHDSHERPPGWDIFAVPEPPPFWIAPEYPLAVAFIPANPGNFTANGLESFDYVVVHTMQGSYNGTISWFQNPMAVVSTHYVMRSNDGEVTQMVLDKDRAYHVGNSNRYALGIEHEGFVEDPNKWYTWATYSSSARLTRWLTIQHAIPVDRTHIVGHSELPSQTHTDPGGGWNWNLYMALIKEVVPPSEIHGVAVDRSKPCTLTANVATEVKRTAMPGGLQPPEDKCAVAAGATLNYWHARRDIDGHHRLFMPAGEGPCAGNNGLDADAYISAAEWSALCPDEAIAAAGVTVQLDGAGPITTGPGGGFTFMTGPGAHTIEAAADGIFQPASQPVDVAVYPGARVVIALDPVPAPDPTDATTDPTTDPTDPTAGETAGETSGIGEAGSGGEEAGETSSASAGETTGGPAGDTGNTPTGGQDSVGAPALPDGYGQDDAGCGCASTSPTGPGLVLLGMLGMLALPRRRRRAR